MDPKDPAEVPEDITVDERARHADRLRRLWAIFDPTECLITGGEDNRPNGANTKGNRRDT